jgi:integrase
VSFDQFGAILRVSGKTGDRRVRVISSAPALTTWLEHYEGADDPEAYLWPPRSNSNHDTNYPAVHGSILKMLNVLAKRAGIKKHVHPHLFRHSRATILASKLTEAQMKEYFGWTQSSKMASTYVHLSGRDVDKALLAIYHINPEQASETQASLKMKSCSRCKEENAPSSRFCSRCGNPLDIALLISANNLQ